MNGTVHRRGHGSSVGIATELWVGQSGIEFRWGRVFPPAQPPVKWVPGGKVWPGRAADHTPHSSAAVMKE